MLKRIQKYANIIPIIAKADSFVHKELLEIKLGLITKAAERKINFFDCREAIFLMLGEVIYI